jgi:hypothetical protein
VAVEEQKRRGEILVRWLGIGAKPAVREGATAVPKQDLLVVKVKAKHPAALRDFVNTDTCTKALV